MAKNRILLRWCPVVLLLSIAPVPGADSISVPTPADTAHTEISRAAADKKQQMSAAQRKRDSTLSALLAALEKEDSLNALALADSSAAAARNERRAEKTGLRELWRQLVLIACRHPKPFAAAGIILLVFLAWSIIAGIAGKRSDKRFMTTTRLSLMDGEVRRACVLIEKRFDDPALTPAAVCTAIVTGEPFLNALFHKELGMSIAGYIAHTRIHRARQFMKENPAAEAAFVASRTGFKDVAEFKTAFEKSAGTKFEDFPKQ